MIIEMRTYKIKPAKRTEFLEVLESKAIPEHQKIGMKILGPFLSVEDDDTFFWDAGFSQPQKPGKNEA
jgi:NIPSNAP